jgi:hypothetical protein
LVTAGRRSSGDQTTAASSRAIATIAGATSADIYCISDLASGQSLGNDMHPSTAAALPATAATRIAAGSEAPVAAVATLGLDDAGVRIRASGDHATSQKDIAAAETAITASPAFVGAITSSSTSTWARYRRTEDASPGARSIPREQGDW